MILRANILLAPDRNSNKPMTVHEVSAIYHTTPTTVQNVRTSYGREEFRDNAVQEEERDTSGVCKGDRRRRIKDSSAGTQLNRKDMSHGR